jgi:hypothetical protein
MRVRGQFCRHYRVSSSYGIFREHLHRNLLWQRTDREKMQQIGYAPGTIPSWSWMAYSGGIQFMDIPFGQVNWNRNLQLNKEHKYVFFNIFEKKGRRALVNDIGVFRNCSLEQSNISYTVLAEQSRKRAGLV